MTPERRAQIESTLAAKPWGEVYPDSPVAFAVDLLEALVVAESERGAADVRLEGLCLRVDEHRFYANDATEAELFERIALAARKRL